MVLSMKAHVGLSIISILHVHAKQERKIVRSPLAPSNIDMSGPLKKATERPSQLGKF